MTTSERSHSRPPAGPLVLPFRERAPRVDPSAWLAPGVVVAGDVEIGADTSLWFGTVVRGDVEAIRIGARSNLQDHCIVHVTKGLFPAWIGDEVTVGHRAIVHGCTIRDGALVGIGAVVLDGGEVGEEALVGAGALVTQGTKVPARHLVLGAPARVVRPLSDDEVRRQRERALEYVATARVYGQRSSSDSGP